MKRQIETGLLIASISLFTGGDAAFAASLLQIQPGNAATYEQTFTPYTSVRWRGIGVRQVSVDLPLAPLTAEMRGSTAGSSREIDYLSDSLFVQRFKQTYMNLKFESFSADAKTLVVDLTYKNPRWVSYAGYPSLLLSNHAWLRVKAEFRITGCDQHSIDTDVSYPESLEDVVRSFRDAAPLDFMTCELQSGNVVLSDVMKQEGAFEAGTLAGEFPVPPDSFDVVPNQTLIIGSDGALSRTAQYSRSRLGSEFYLTPQSAADPKQVAAIKASTERIVSLLRDYGNGLVGLSDQSAAIKAVFIDQYLNKSGQALSEALDDVRSRVPYVGIVDLISVNASINRAYNYVHYLEGKISGGYRLGERLGLQH